MGQVTRQVIVIIEAVAAEVVIQIITMRGTEDKPVVALESLCWQTKGREAVLLQKTHLQTKKEQPIIKQLRQIQVPPLWRVAGPPSSLKVYQIVELSQALLQQVRNESVIAASIGHQ